MSSKSGMDGSVNNHTEDEASKVSPNLLELAILNPTQNESVMSGKVFQVCRIHAEQGALKFCKEIARRISRFIAASGGMLESVTVVLALTESHTEVSGIVWVGDDLEPMCYKKHLRAERARRLLIEQAKSTEVVVTGDRQRVRRKKSCRVGCF